MTAFFLAVASFILLMVALGLVRILRGPDTSDRLMAAQLIGSGGVAVLLLLSASMRLPAITARLTLSFSRTPMLRICSVGSMKVRPT